MLVGLAYGVLVWRAVVRAAMGAFFAQTIVRSTATELALWIKQHGVRAVGAVTHADQSYREFDYTGPTLFVLGHERTGLSQRQEKLCTDFVKIPMCSDCDSLNVSIAGSLLVYESAHAKVFVGSG